MAVEPQTIVCLAVARVLLDGGAVIQSRFLILARREELVPLRYIGFLRRAASAAATSETTKTPRHTTLVHTSLVTCDLRLNLETNTEVFRRAAWSQALRLLKQSKVQLQGREIQEPAVGNVLLQQLPGTRCVVVGPFSSAKVPDVAATDLFFRLGNSHRGSQLRSAHYTIFGSPNRGESANESAPREGQ